MEDIVNQLQTFQIILLLALIQQLGLHYVEPSLMVLSSHNIALNQHILHQPLVRPESVRLLLLLKELLNALIIVQLVDGLELDHVWQLQAVHYIV